MWKKLGKNRKLFLAATEKEIAKSLSVLEIAGEDALAKMQHSIRGRPRVEPALSEMAEEAVALVHRQEERTAKLRDELVPEIRRKSAEALDAAKITVFEGKNLLYFYKINIENMVITK